MREVVAIQDLQFGSTGKGQIAGTVGHVWRPDTVATAWGPNAGHTYRDGDHKSVHTMLAVCALVPSVKTILVGPGSVVDPSKLAIEIKTNETLLRGKIMIVHPQAVWWQPEDADAEAGSLLRIGSTMKGTMAAYTRKLYRTSNAVMRACVGNSVFDILMSAAIQANMGLIISSDLYDRAVDRSEKMILEGAQGYSLGIHIDFYPYTTGRDVSTAQLLADCRIPFPDGIRSVLATIGVARTYPIRVANRVDDRTGEQVGTSGPCYPDQQEIRWEDLGREPELTTVTKLPRRLFTFSKQQFREACRVMNPYVVALTFCDYLEQVDGPPGEGNGPRTRVPEHVRKFVDDHITMGHGMSEWVGFMSYGPDRKDVYELGPSWELNPVTADCLQSLPS